MKQIPLWTAPEVERLLRLADAHDRNWQKVALRMPGRTAVACQIRFYMPPHLRVSGLPRPAPPPSAASSASDAITARLKTEAARRAALTHTTITAAVLGDPLPGRSALDQKRASISQITLPTLPAGGRIHMET
jgi:hypothetical protein